MEQNMTAMTYKIKEIAGRIRELREVTGLTVEEMAQNRAEAKKNAAEADKAKERPAAKPAGE